MMYLYGLRGYQSKMRKILNSLFLVMKFILLISSFSITLYIMLSMYSRVNKDIIEALPIFVPYAILLLLFFINETAGQKQVNNNIFYNVTCCLVFSCICLVGVRAILDKNMLLNEIMGYNINFSYYSDFIPFMKIMIYGLILSNIMFMIKEKDSEELKLARKIEVL